MLKFFAIRNTFKAYERLKREQHIDTLFRSGKAFSVFPLRVIYRTLPRPNVDAPPILTGFSVPKKKFGSSVKRHRIRRLIVEAWRLNRHNLTAIVPADEQLHLFFIFTDKAMPVYETVKTAVIAGIEKLTETIAHTQTQQDT